jgi:hypothetical protein
MIILLSGAAFAAGAASPWFAAVSTPRFPFATIAIAGKFDAARSERRERSRDQKTVLGNVVSAYRDGGGWTLLIDKGSASKLRTGMTGEILQGPSGDTPLPGGAFAISAVVGPSKSLARTQVRIIGKNTRVVINLAPQSRRGHMRQPARAPSGRR